jgi:hypothetical protein
MPPSLGAKGVILIAFVEECFQRVDVLNKKIDIFLRRMSDEVFSANSVDGFVRLRSRHFSSLVGVKVTRVSVGLMGPFPRDIESRFGKPFQGVRYKPLGKSGNKSPYQHFSEIGCFVRSPRRHEERQ